MGARKAGGNVSFPSAPAPTAEAALSLLAPEIDAPGSFQGLWRNPSELHTNETGGVG